MPTVHFTANLAKHRDTPKVTVEAATVRAAIDAATEADPLLRGYVVDDQGRLRKHVNIFIDGALISDRLRLSDAVSPRSEIFVMQALSGG